MTKGSEIPLWKRHVIIAYSVQMGMSPSQIAPWVNASRKAVQIIIQRAQQRSTSSNIEDLMHAATVAPRPGRPKRAEPGSDLSHAIREGVQIHENHPIEQAAKPSCSITPGADQF